MNGIKFELLDAKDSPSFEDLHRIYLESIPMGEQKLKAQIAEMARRPDYRILLAKREGRVLGFSAIFLPEREPFGLLEYMAVETAERSGGVGTALFLRSLQTVGSVQGAVPVLVEVDSERNTFLEPETVRRRQRFYRGLGCLRVKGLEYILPLPVAPPPEMDLLVYVPSSIRNIPKASLERWLKVVYREAYGCPADDSRIARMLEPVGDPVKLV